MADHKFTVQHVKSHYEVGIYTKEQVIDFINRGIIESSDKKGVFIDCGEEEPAEVVVTFRNSTGKEVPQKESVREYLYGEAEKFLAEKGVLLNEEEDILAEILGTNEVPEPEEAPQTEEAPQAEENDVPVATQEEEELAQSPFQENPVEEAEYEEQNVQPAPKAEPAQEEPEESTQAEVEHAELNAQNFNF